MARYIDADKLIEHIKDVPTWYEGLGIGWRSTKYPDGMFDCDDVINSIDNQPTADVEEVKHGKWYRHTQKEHGDTCFYCSVCEEMALSDCMVWELTDYCPHCGAKMDGGNAE